MKKAVYKAPSDEDPVEAVWEHQEDEDEEQKIFIGKVSFRCPFVLAGARRPPADGSPVLSL